MPLLSPLAWILWGAVIVGQSALTLRLLWTGAHRRWRALFALIFLMTLKDFVLLADVLIWRDPFVYFYAFWYVALIGLVVEVWLMVDIGCALAGITPWLRRVICQGIPDIAAITLMASIAFAFSTPIPSYTRICFVVSHLDEAVSFAWLVVFFIIALTTEIAGPEWSGGVRGIGIGLALEIFSSSSASWLTVHSVSPSLLSTIKSAIYLISLTVWGASLRPRTPSDTRHLLPMVSRVLTAYSRIFEKYEVPQLR